MRLCSLLVLHIRLMLFIEINWLRAFSREKSPLKPIVVLRAEVHFLRFLFAAISFAVGWQCGHWASGWCGTCWFFVLKLLRHEAISFL